MIIFITYFSIGLVFWLTFFSLGFVAEAHQHVVAKHGAVVAWRAAIVAFFIIVALWPLYLIPNNKRFTR